MPQLIAFLSATPLPVRARTVTRAAVCMVDEPASDSQPESDLSSSNSENRPKKLERVVKKRITTIRSTATWANVFLPEFGRKGPGSNPDWDLRPKSLRKPEEGAGVCDSCKGTGTMTCSFCNGNDFYDQEGHACKCPACESKKNITCSACFGSKKQIELEGNWWEKGVAALFKE